MMIKILQACVSGIFALMAVAGVIVFIWFPSKLVDFGTLCNIIFPIFLTSVIPALIGTPLTEAVRNLTGQKDASKTN